MRAEKEFPADTARFGSTQSAHSAALVLVVLDRKLRPWEEAKSLPSTKAFRCLAAS